MRTGGPGHEAAVHPRAWLLWTLAAVPVVVTTVRALARGWMPMGDNAYFSIRARDVLTEHHPLLGAWSSGSLTVGVDVNNLGPLQLDLLALPIRVDWASGTAVGVATINVAAVAVAAFAARRVAGTAGALVVALAAAGLVWGLGELVYEPRQHHALVLPWLAYLVLVWAMVAGDRRSLPWAVAVGSLVLQTHLSYALLVPALGALGAVGLVLAVRRERLSASGEPGGQGSSDGHEQAEGPGPWPWRTAIAVTVAVATLAWVQPMVDQVAGRGNLGNVWRASRAGEDTAGLDHGIRAVASVAGTPVGWLPPSFREFDPTAGLPGTAGAVAALVVVALVLSATGVLAHRRGDRAVVAAAVTAGVAVVGAVVAAAGQTTGGPFGLVAGNHRFLWPIAAVTWAVPVLAAARWVAVAAPGPRPVVAGLAGAVALTSALALVPSSTRELVRADEDLIPVAREVLPQLDALRGRGTVVVERSDLFFAEPYTYVLMAGLQDRSIDWQVAERVDVLRFGDGRARSPDASTIVWLAAGDDAVTVEPGHQRIAFATGLSEAEQRELRNLRNLRGTGTGDDRRAVLEARWQRETVAVLARPAGTAERSGP
jgi:hypothetical protein